MTAHAEECNYAGILFTSQIVKALGGCVWLG